MEISDLTKEDIQGLNLVFEHHYIYDKWNTCSNNEEKAILKKQLEVLIIKYKKLDMRIRDNYNNMICSLLEANNIIKCDNSSEVSFYHSQVGINADRFHENGMFHSLLPEIQKEEAFNHVLRLLIDDYEKRGVRKHHIPDIVEELYKKENHSISEYICDKMLKHGIGKPERHPDRLYKWTQMLTPEGVDFIEKHGNWSGFLEYEKQKEIDAQQKTVINYGNYIENNEGNLQQSTNPTKSPQKQSNKTTNNKEKSTPVLQKITWVVIIITAILGGILGLNEVFNWF